MVYTNFPSGVTSFGVPQISNGLPITTGNYWFVSSVLGSDGNPGNDASLPFKTTQAAINASAAGDVIVLLPNHAETVSAAAGITTTGKPGIFIIGQGEGSTRPTYTFATSTAATFAIASAGVTLANVVGVCNIDQIVSPFVISAADCTFGLPGNQVEWHDGASNKEALRAVLTTAAADRLNMNLVYYGFTGGSHGVNAVRLVGCDNGNINILYYGICTTAVVEFATTACTDINVTGYIYVSGTTNFSKDVVDTITGSTWSANIFDGAAGVTVTGGSGSALASSDTSSFSGSIEKSVSTSAAVMSNNLVAFTVAGGPIEIMGLVSICATANDTTASTLQWTATGTLGSTSATITGATATLASATAGTSVTTILTALTTAPTINANAAALMSTGPSTILAPAGTLKLTIGVGSTTGTWSHYLRYKPLSAAATVTAAF